MGATMRTWTVETGKDNDAGQQGRVLLLIDVQSGFVCSDETRAARDAIVQILRGGRFSHVVATLYMNFEGSMFERLLGWKGMTMPSEQRIDPQVEPYLNEVKIKTTYSCFGKSSLDWLSPTEGPVPPEEVYIAGMDTDCSVLANALQLMDRGIRPVVLVDCCASTGGQAAHEAGLLIMRRALGERQLVRGLPLFAGGGSARVSAV